MRSFLAFVALASAAPAVVAERTLTLSDFDRMRVEGSYVIDVTNGRGTTGRVSGAPQALDQVSIEVKDRTLIIRPGKTKWGGDGDSAGAPLRIRITTPALHTAWLSGSGIVTISGMRGTDLRLALSGSGSLVANGMAADRMTLATAGAGNVTLAGRVAQASFTIRGSGTVDATKLLVQDIRVSSEGAGDARAVASRSANVSASGTGNVVVRGGMACVVNNVGAGTVSCGAAPR
jgi:Putative auto-transporter adhesin, head GIN domain